MINPFYFPYTFLSDKERASIELFFDKVTVFRTFEPEKTDSGVHVVLPVSGDEDHVKAFLKEYKYFAALNMEKASSFLKSTSQKPLFDPTWASELRSEIVRFMDNHGHDDAGDEQTAQSLLWARSFIEIAHEYDENNRNIDAELETVAYRERQLFDALMGGDREEEDELVFSKEPGMVESDASGVRIKHRLAAWVTLFAHAWPDKDKTGEGFYVTTRSEVIEELGEFVPNFCHVCDIGANDMTKEELEDRIRRLVIEPYSHEDKNRHFVAPMRKKNVLSLYIADNLSPCECFSGILNRNISVSNDLPAEIKNTVIGLIGI